MRLMSSPFAALCLALGLAACSAPQTLSPALSARMDQPGAQLDRAQALNLINQFRSTRGLAPLQQSASLNQQAQTLAAQYASSGQTPAKPGDVSFIRISAGYANFAETFSGWRGTNADAAALIDPNARSAGLGVAYQSTSAYGVHWVLLLDDASGELAAR